MDINKQTSEEILKEVEGGLSGDIKKDMTYLGGALKKYNEIEDFDTRKKVLNGIQQMMFKVSPEESKKAAAHTVAAMQKHYKNVLDIAMAYTRERKADCIRFNTLI